MDQQPKNPDCCLHPTETIEHKSRFGLSFFAFHVILLLWQFLSSPLIGAPEKRRKGDRSPNDHSFLRGFKIFESLDEKAAFHCDSG
jgi:hypothetical protein